MYIELEHTNTIRIDELESGDVFRFPKTNKNDLHMLANCTTKILASDDNGETLSLSLGNNNRFAVSLSSGHMFAIEDGSFEVEPVDVKVVYADS